MLLNCGTGEDSCKEIKLVNPKGNQPWIFIGRTDAEAEAPIHWSCDVKSWLTGKDPDAGKDWGQQEKGATEDKMVEWHHQLSGHEFEQTLVYSERQGSLACCSPGVANSWTGLKDWTTIWLWVTRVPSSEIETLSQTLYISIEQNKEPRNKLMHL